MMSWLPPSLLTVNHYSYNEDFIMGAILIPISRPLAPYPLKGTDKITYHRCKIWVMLSTICGSADDMNMCSNGVSPCAMRT
jgi:hypothetical protein